MRRSLNNRPVWACRIALGRDADGKRISLNKTIHGTRTVAQRWISEQLAKKYIGAVIFKTKVQLSEYLQKWLTEIAKPRVSERTFDGYEWLLNHHIMNKPHLCSWRWRQQRCWCHHRYTRAISRSCN